MANRQRLVLAGTCTLTRGGGVVGSGTTARSIAVGTRLRGSRGVRLRCQCAVPSASHSSHR